MAARSGVDTLRRSGSRFGVLSALAIVVTGSGCAASGDGGWDDPRLATAPHVVALSTYAASLGTPIDAIIANPPAATTTKMELVFRGTFKHPDGRTEPVDMAQTVNRADAGAVRWTSFGPFANPFTPKAADVGVFNGTVGLRTTDADGTQRTDNDPMRVQFEVKPSIIVTELQPTTADCAKPALRLIGAMPYKMRATTIGFRPTTIEYSYTMPGVVPDTAGKPTFDLAADGQPKAQVARLTHTMLADVDVVDGSEALMLPPVPVTVPSYGVIFSIVARDAAGHQVSSSFGITAHRPLEVYYDGRFQLAQVYPATPVSACTPGGQQGRSVSYSESTSESRSRSLSVSLSKNFSQSEDNHWSTSDGISISRSASVNNGYNRSRSTSNSFNFSYNHSDSSGVSFNWGDSVSSGTGGSSGWSQGNSASIDFKLFGMEGMSRNQSNDRNGSKNYNSSTSRNTGGSTNQGSSDGWSQGNSTSESDSLSTDHSESTTDSTSVSTSTGKSGGVSSSTGTGESLSDSWNVSSSESISSNFSGQILANTYGVFYRQLARYTQRAFVLEYDKCGERQVVGDLEMQDYVWAPDLALSDSCPPLPQSNFPPAQCFVPPCDP